MKDAEVSVNRCFKSRLFVMVFEDKKELLELYNAVSGKNYEDPDMLEINTLQNAIYMSMQNDLSFIIDSRISLYEHQSTYNPNLPLRFLLYISDVYSGLTKDENLYGTKLVRLPTPQFVVFYNGEQEVPDRMEMKISDAYTVQTEDASLELKAMLLNINPGHNEKLMGACRTLREYAEYTARVRRYAGSMSLEEAVERAITECIREGILTDFLKKNRAEAKNVSIYEYDMEKHMRMEREDAYTEGLEKGRSEGLADGITSLLSSLGELPETVCSRIREEKDPDILKMYLKKAAAAGTIEEFCEAVKNK